MSYTEDELMQLLKKNPMEFIQLLEQKKLDFDEAKKSLDVGRKIVQERYSMSKDDIDAVEFVFWFTYFVEREAQDLIVWPEVQLGARREAMQVVTERLSFGDKITVISKLYVKDAKKDAFVSLLHQVNNLRNSVAHGHFDQLKYGGYSLSDFRGQLKITADLMNVSLKKRNKEEAPE